MESRETVCQRLTRWSGHQPWSGAAMARPATIQGDARWLQMMLQCRAKECRRRRNAACSTQTELHGVAFSIHGSIQVHQLAPHLDKRFINPPAPTHRSFESAPTLFTRVRITNDPTQDRGVEKSINPAHLKSRPGLGNSV